MSSLTVDSVNNWARRNPSARLIQRLANHEIAVHHTALDELPQNEGVHYVRTLLVAAGLLQPRDEILQRFDQWCAHFLANALVADRAVLEPYVRWHVGQKLQRMAHRAPIKSSTTRLARQKVRAASTFLTYLRAHGILPGEVKQSTLDDLVVTHPQIPTLLAGFLTWGATNRILPHLHLELPRTIFPSAGLSETDYHQTIQRLETDPVLPLRVRTAGLLIGLYGQELTRVVALTEDDFYRDQEQLYVHLGTSPVRLPPHLAALILEQQQDAALVHTPNSPRWLYPSVLTGHHLAPKTISASFAQHGVRATPLRNAGLVNLAGHIPIGPLCDLTGIGPYAASRWADIAGRRWSIYPKLRVENQP
ncbi:hypothetical protein P4U43_13690 [Arthrobacter sp. EH-1B-1]|uniref:Uncharacterized protein n=1 Tax=Arthrobacter vasquezii TaxID=2977629 RepID=A0ABT6CXL8_9MICC|nr:hypothetical protein [Arthrobacter vasquezii]MDF9278838.1 hypothetical protein [Arthrobacter vasquezii]